MRAADIVLQLASVLPQLSDKFTREIAVTSVVRAATELTVTTSSDHGLTTNDIVHLTGAVTTIPTTPTRVGVVGTIVTATDHDLTKLSAATLNVRHAHDHTQRSR